MKKRFAVLLALSAVGLLAFGAQGDDTLEQVMRRGTLVVGVKYRVPPFSFVDNATGDLVGYDVDVAKAVASKLGVKLQLRPVDQRSRIPELLEGNIDLIAANLVKNPNTDEVIDFSDVYLITGQGFLAKKGAVKGLRDLRGKKIGVIARSPSEKGVRASLPGAKIVAFTDYKKKIQALQKGTINAASGDASILPALLALLPQGKFEISPVQIAEIPYVMGVRQGDKSLLDVVNRTIRELEQSGEAQKLLDKWFRPRQPAAGPAAQAEGAIVRNASAPPGVVVVVLRGTFVRGAEVSVFTPAGDYVCKGRVASVFTDQVYVDVEPDKYRSLKAGFAVSMNVNRDAAKAAILKHQGVLKAIQGQSKKDEDAYKAQREKDGIAKEKRQIEADRKAYESELRIEEQRANENDYYYNRYRGHRFW